MEMEFTSGTVPPPTLSALEGLVYIVKRKKKMNLGGVAMKMSNKNDISHSIMEFKDSCAILDNRNNQRL